MGGGGGLGVDIRMVTPLLVYEACLSDGRPVPKSAGKLRLIWGRVEGLLVVFDEIVAADVVVVVSTIPDEE